MKINKVITNRDSMTVRNEFVWEDLQPHIIDAIKKKIKNFDSGYITGFIQLSKADSFRRDNIEWSDHRLFCVGMYSNVTMEMKLIPLFDLMPELQDLYDEK